MILDPPDDEAPAPGGEVGLSEKELAPVLHDGSDLVLYLGLIGLTVGDSDYGQNLDRVSAGFGSGVDTLNPTPAVNLIILSVIGRKAGVPVIVIGNRSNSRAIRKQFPYLARPYLAPPNPTAPCDIRPRRTTPCLASSEL